MLWEPCFFRRNSGDGHFSGGNGRGSNLVAHRSPRETVAGGRGAGNSARIERGHERETAADHRDCGRRNHGDLHSARRISGAPAMTGRFQPGDRADAKRRFARALPQIQEYLRASRTSTAARASPNSRIRSSLQLSAISSKPLPLALKGGKENLTQFQISAYGQLRADT
jgi:hypothetical protein